MKPRDLWNDLLERDRDAVLAGLPAFREDLKRRGAHFGGRPLVNHLRPKFLTEKDAADLKLVSEAVMAGLMEAKERVLADPDTFAMLNLSDVEQTMVAADPGYDYVCPSVRLDAFLTDEGPRFVELNGECPAGVGFGDRIAQGFAEHPLFRAFAERRHVRPVPTLPAILKTLLSCWESWGGAHEPTIAIIDFLDVPTAEEFRICRDHFREQGHDAHVFDAREIEYDGKTLSCKGTRIDLVYKRLLMKDMVERYEEVKNLWLAYRDGAICMVNSCRSKLVQKKAIFAIITGDDRDAWLSKEHRAAIDRAVPWTRNLLPKKTRYRGEEIDLLDYLRERREDFVLKPNDDYGGKGITLGWEVDQPRWEAALDAAIGRDYVVQERIRLVTEPFPSMNHELAMQELYVDLDPFLFLGEMVGALARLGVGGLCNVTSGGGQVPLFVVGDEKESR